MTGARLAGVRGPQCASHPAQATRLRRAAHRHVAVEHRGILTVWAVATHSSDSARPNPCKMGCSWVLLSREALILKALDAGIDQLGGECCSEVIVGQLRDGRLDDAARCLRPPATGREIDPRPLRQPLQDRPSVVPVRTWIDEITRAPSSKRASDRWFSRVAAQIAARTFRAAAAFHAIRMPYPTGLSGDIVYGGPVRRMERRGDWVR